MTQKRFSKRTDKLEVRMSPEEKADFLDAVCRQRRTASEVIRSLIAQYVGAARHSVAGRSQHRWRTRTIAAAAATGAVASVALWPSAADPVLTSAEYDLKTRDRNGDGSLSYDEYADQTDPAREQMSGEQKQWFDDWQRGYFDGIDTDADGLISTSEYQSHWDKEAEERFRKADLNGDGALVLDELLAGRGDQRLIASAMVFVSNFHPGIYDERAPLVDDTDKDAPLTGEQSARLGQTFAILDRDRDGRITLQEHLRPDR